MSKKTGQPPAAAARAPGGRPGDAAVVERLLGRLLTAVAAGDPLKAELETATFMAIPHAMGKASPEEVEAFIANVLVDGAVTMRTPDGAALLRLLALLGSPATKRAASQGRPADPGWRLPAGLGDRGREAGSRPGLAPVRRVRRR